ncbi:MAG TPA: heavy metal-binding domain-containing protein [Prolixibacteraceae bacterium]|nr:heavy metal-binding domain-containing protein [Prolixibacteraceae bacterium]
MKKQSEPVAEYVTKQNKQELHSCCGGNEHKHHQDNNSGSATSYQCPMKCEGDKIYNVPGTCPVCNMHLAPIK